jgi:hypothetical protein
VNRTTALTAAGLLLVALPLAACTSSKPTETASRTAQGGGSATGSRPPHQRPRIVDGSTRKSE